MALVAKMPTYGFERVTNLLGFPTNPSKYELTPGVSFKRGDLVVLSGGRVAKATPGASNILGVMAETIDATANPAGKVTHGLVYDNPFDVFRCSFSGHRDAVATGGSATTLVDANLSASTDDAFVGALLYVYEGPGAGAVRTVVDYDGTSKTLTVEEPFPEPITDESRYILLGAGTAAGDAINVGSVGVNILDERTINAGGSIANEAGPLVVLSIDVENLTMDVLIRKHLYNR